MRYDVRNECYTFKHVTDDAPVLSRERYREHYHTVYELLYFLDGDADFSIQHTLYHLKPHCLLVVRPGEMHNLVPRSEKRYERIVLRFDSIRISPEIHEGLSRLEKVYDIRGTYLSEEFLRLDRHYQEVDEEYRLTALLGSLHLILSHLCSGKAESVRADYVNENLARTMAYVHDNIAAVQTMEDICDAMHLSPTTLKRVFQETFQMPVMTYIRAQKCMLARDLMRAGASAQEAGLRCGFEYYSTFYRAYMKVFGHAPSSEVCG